MIGTIIWYNVGGGHKTIGIITDHHKNISLSYSVWSTNPTIIENAVKIYWIKEKGLKPKPLNYYSPVPGIEDDLFLSESRYSATDRWYDLKNFKIISDIK
jgi:hypothetical protein